jgi:hypothetical protein
MKDNNINHISESHSKPNGRFEHCLLKPMIGFHHHHHTYCIVQKSENPCKSVEPGMKGTCAIETYEEQHSYILLS